MNVVRCHINNISLKIKEKEKSKYVYLQRAEVYCDGIPRCLRIFAPWAIPRNVMSPHEVLSQWLLRHITKRLSVWYVTSHNYVSMIYLYSTAKILNIMNIILSELSTMQNACLSSNFIMPKRITIKYYHFQYFCFRYAGCTSDTLRHTNSNFWQY